jgi:hypothetical protein
LARKSAQFSNKEVVRSLFRFRNKTQLVNSSQGLSWHDVKKGGRKASEV